MDTVVAQLDAAIKDKDEVTAKLATVEATVEALKKEKGELAINLEALRAEHAALVAKHDADAKAAADALQSEMAKRIKADEELAVAKQALANPAFAAAAVSGSKKPVAEGTSEAAETKTTEEWRAEYRKISDPVMAAKFRKEHRKELGLA